MAGHAGLTSPYWLSLLGEIAEMAGWKAGWDGPDSSAMPVRTPVRVQNFLSHWPPEYENFDAEMAYDGILSLQTYDQDGFTYGGVHFYADFAGFTVIDRTTQVDFGSFDPDNVAAVRAVVARAIAGWRKAGIIRQ